MKHIRFASDIHLDFDIAAWHKGLRRSHGVMCDMDMLWYPEPMEGDDETTLVIPGDLWVERRFLSRKHPATKKSWMQELSGRFKYVVFVLGNHDYWGQNLSKEPGRIKSVINDDKLTNVFFLENLSIVLDQVKFLGGTLWTDFARQDPLLMFNAPNVMNDYKYIRNGASFGRLHPRDLLAAHLKTRSFISNNCVKDDPAQRIMVVTHMAPSYMSYAKAPFSSKYQPYYASDLSDMILDDCQDAEWWLHGHIHDPADYMIGNTRVMCNPRGYSRQQIKWDPLMRIDL